MAHKFVCSPDTAVVETEKGKVRGYQYDDLYIFKGIPYAKARRFHAPEPADSWEGVFHATNYGYVCPLLEIPKPGGELYAPHRYWVMNEDCQNLNIWTPGLDDGKRAVLVWLHGGGYEAGSAIEQIAYDGANMSRFGQVVVVSVNHRLNILGFCDLSDFGEEYANSGNAGMDDIISALKWVKNNIAAFGGDPDNVTLFGQSGGGAKVTTLLQMPAADGLYAKGINMSGVIGKMLSDETGSGKNLALALLAELELKTIKDLEAVDYPLLAAAYKKVVPELMVHGKYVGGKPHPNAFYKGSPDLNGFRKETADIPMIIGSLYGEFTSFQPCSFDRNHMSRKEGENIIRDLVGDTAADKMLHLFKSAYPERNPIDLYYLDSIFRVPGIQYIKHRSALNECTWSYLFNLDMNIDGGRTPWHCVDIPYVFHNTELVEITQQEGITEKIEQQIFETVMAFAKNANPNNPSIPYWPASKPDAEYVLVIGEHTDVRVNFDHELMSLQAEFMEPVREQEIKDYNIQH